MKKSDTDYSNYDEELEARVYFGWGRSLSVNFED